MRFPTPKRRRLLRHWLVIVSQAERMMECLKQEFDPETETALTWLEIFLVQMAGDMRYEPAIPLIIKKLLVDGELLNEECDKALTKIGTDAVIRAVRDAYPQAPNHFRLYSSGILRRHPFGPGRFGGPGTIISGTRPRSENVVGKRPGRSILDRGHRRRSNGAAGGSPGLLRSQIQLGRGLQADGLRRSRIEAVGTRTCRAKTTICQQRITASGLRSISMTNPTFHRSRPA